MILLQKNEKTQNTQKTEKITVPDDGMPGKMLTVTYMAPLSDSEIERVVKHNSYAAKLYQAIQELQQFKFASPTLGACIASLIAGLTDGGVSRKNDRLREGTDEVAGKQANRAIAAFFQIINTLPTSPVNLRKELSLMSCDYHDFEHHLRKLDEADYEAKLSKLQEELNKIPAVLKYQAEHQALAKLRTRRKEITDSKIEDGEKAALLAKISAEETEHIAQYEGAKAQAEKEGCQLFAEMKELTKHTAKCIEQNASDWQAFLNKNKARLYNMTIDRSAGVGEQVVVLEERIQEYVQELDDYLNQSEANTQYRAELALIPDETIYAMQIRQWLAASRDEEVALNKLDFLVSQFNMRPQWLIETEVIPLLSDTQVALLVRHFDSELVEPVLETISNAGKTSINIETEAENSLEILTRCHNAYAACGFSVSKSDWQKQKDLDRILTNMFRLLYAKHGNQAFGIDKGYSLLLFAAQCKHARLVELLVAKGASEQRENTTSIILRVASSKNMAMVRLLIPAHKQFDPNIVRAICLHGDESICELLFDHYISLGVNRVNLAEWFFELGQSHGIQNPMLVALKKSTVRAINSAEISGLTPLIQFTVLNRPLVVRALLQAHADVTCRNTTSGKTALMYAASAIWHDCLTHVAGSAPDRPSIRDAISSYLAKRSDVFCALLEAQFPGEYTRAYMQNNIFRLALHHIDINDLETYITVVSNGATDPALKNILSMIIHHLDLMTAMQREWLLSTYFINKLTAVMLALCPENKNLIEEGKWNELVLKLMEQEVSPIRNLVFTILLRARKIDVNGGADSGKSLLQLSIIMNNEEVFNLLVNDPHLIINTATDELFELSLQVGALFAVRYLFDPSRHLTVDHLKLTLNSSNQLVLAYLYEQFSLRGEPEISKVCHYLIKHAIALSSANHLPYLLMQAAALNLDTRYALHDAEDLLFERYANILMALLYPTANAASVTEAISSMTILDRSARIYVTLAGIEPSLNNKECYIVIHQAFYYLVSQLSLTRLQELIRKHVTHQQPCNRQIILSIAGCVESMPEENRVWFVNEFFNQVFPPPGSDDQPQEDPAKLLFAFIGFDSVWSVPFILSKTGVNINYLDAKTGLTTLQHSMKVAKYFNLLLSLPGIDLNLRSSTNETTLMLAATAGERDRVTALLACKADTSLTDNNGDTALIRAVRAGSNSFGAMLGLDQMIVLLLPHDPILAEQAVTKTNKQGETVLSIINQDRNRELLLLIKKCWPAVLHWVNPVTDRTMLMDAAHTGDLPFACWLLAAGANLGQHTKAGSARQLAELANHAEVVTTLDFIERNNLPGNMSLLHWCQINSPAADAVVEFLTARQLDLPVHEMNDAQHTPLMISAARGHINQVEHLLKCGTGLFTNQAHESAMTLARQAGHQQICALLAKHAFEQYRQAVMREPRQILTFGHFGSGSREARTAKVIAAAIVSRAIDAYLEAANFNLDFVDYMLTTGRRSLCNMMHVIPEDRLRDMCKWILGEGPLEEILSESANQDESNVALVNRFNMN